MFKLIVVVLLTLIALSVIQIANNQSLTEQDKHTLLGFGEQWNQKPT